MTDAEIIKSLLEVNSTYTATMITSALNILKSVKEIEYQGALYNRQEYDQWVNNTKTSIDDINRNIRECGQSGPLKIRCLK